MSKTADKITQQERETIIVFNEADKTAEIFTYNAALKNKLQKLAQTQPDEAAHTASNDFGGETFTVPKTYIKVTPPVRQNLTDEQREVMRERFKQNILS